MPVWTAKEKALCLWEAVSTKQAEEALILEIGALTSLADYFIICTATSKPQSQAIVDAVTHSLLQAGERPIGIEGGEAGLWVLMDCSDVILHIFRPEIRTFYNLEWLWRDAPQIALPVPKAMVL